MLACLTDARNSNFPIVLNVRCARFIIELMRAQSSVNIHITETKQAQSTVPVRSSNQRWHSRLCPSNHRDDDCIVGCAHSITELTQVQSSVPAQKTEMMRVQWAKPKYFHLYCRDSGIYSYTLASDWRTQLEKYTIATICFKASQVAVEIALLCVVK